MRRQETVLNVHSWRERQLADSAQDQRPVGRLVGVLPEYHGPVNIEGLHTHRRGRNAHSASVWSARARPLLPPSSKACPGRGITARSLHDALA